MERGRWEKQKKEKGKERRQRRKMEPEIKGFSSAPDEEQKVGLFTVAAIRVSVAVVSLELFEFLLVGSGKGGFARAACHLVHHHTHCSRQ